MPNRWSSNWFVVTALAAATLTTGCDQRSDERATSEPAAALPALAKPVRTDGATGDAARPEPGEPVDVAHGAEPAAETSRVRGAERAERRDTGGRRRASSHAKQSVGASSTGTASGIAVKRLQFSRSIDGREPVAPEQRFAAAELEDVYAFVELANPSGKAGEVVVSFVSPEGKTTKVELEVGAKNRWRTWAKKRAPRAQGTWSVIVSTPSGEELAQSSFEVTE